MSNAKVMRLRPLADKYARMKSDCLTEWQTLRYYDFRSSWVPICKANIGRLKEGDLLLDRSGIQTLHIEGRGIEVYDPSSEELSVRCFQGREHVFVWRNRFDQGFASMFDANEHFSDYMVFSKAMEILLREDERKIYRDEWSLELDMEEAVFFRTSKIRADLIMKFGASHFDAKSSSFAGFGEFMRCYASIDAAAKNARAGEAVLCMYPAMWGMKALNYETIESCRQAIDMTVSLQSSVYKDMIFNVITSELDLSGVKYYDQIFLYDDFHLLEPENYILIR